MLRALIDNGAHIDAVDNNRNSALITAIVYGIHLNRWDNISVLKYVIYCDQEFGKAAELLIEKGADVNIVGQGENTALMWAAYKGE